MPVRVVFDPGREGLTNINNLNLKLNVQITEKNFVNAPQGQPRPVRLSKTVSTMEMAAKSAARNPARPNWPEKTAL